MQLLLMGIIFLLANQAQAQSLTELEIYKRCYIRMVNSVPLTTDALYKSVQAGTKNGATACIELFDSARFGTNGILQKPTSKEAKSILKTFNDLHRTWFQSRVTPERTASVVIDMEEPALFFTRAAFGANVNFKTIVTGNKGLAGVRVRTENGLNKFQAQRIFAYPSNVAIANAQEFIIAVRNNSLNAAGTAVVATTPSHAPLVTKDSDLVDIGELVGVKETTPLVLNSFYGGFSIRLPSDTTKISPDRLNAAKTLLSEGVDFRQHFGGGIMGSQTFLYANANLNFTDVPDGYDLINRRLTSRVFEDLLCHQLPSLTAGMVKGETEEFIRKKSVHTFQTATSCMQCHSSIDGLGFAFRNVFIAPSGGLLRTDSQEVGARIIAVMKLPIVPDAKEFAFQAPTGTLHYRENITGLQRKSTVTSLAQAGSLLAEHNDIYSCAAKRYYYFFTGVNVDITRAPANSLDQSHYNKVKALGESLKKSQSVRSLLFEIFKSDAFKSWNYRSKGDL